MHGLFVPLVLVIANVLVFIRMKAWRVVLEFLPLFLLIVIFAAEMRDRLVAWRVL